MSDRAAYGSSPFRAHAKRVGVYVITNLITNVIYVGSAAKSFHYRWGMHVRELKRGTHRNPLLQASWRKHGEDSFTFGVLEECSREECVKREQFWMDSLLPHIPHYNVCRVAGSCLGRRLSRDQCMRISERNKGRKTSDEARARLSASGRLRGHTIARDNLAKMIAARSRVRSESHRKSISDRMRGITPWNKGRPMLPHVKKALDESQAKIVYTPERRAAISARHKGKITSEVTKAKMRVAALARIAKSKEANHA